MAKWLLSVKNIPRINRFPFVVSRIFYCNDFFIPSRACEWSEFEVCIRLQTDSLYVEDTVNGKCLKMSCPNVVCRFPGVKWSTKSSGLRDVIAFVYEPKTAELLKNIGMYPQKFGWTFVMTSEISNLVSKIRDLFGHLHTPGAADRLDWICFSLLGQLLLPENCQEMDNDKNRIFNISNWLQMHFAQAINIDEVAMAHGMSHTNFYHFWKKYFSISPAQYIINLRLEAAAKSLVDTSKPISQILKEMHFSGEYVFYKRFREKYGMTPNEYRKQGIELIDNIH